MTIKIAGHVAIADTLRLELEQRNSLGEFEEFSRESVCFPPRDFSDFSVACKNSRCVAERIVLDSCSFPVVVECFCCISFISSRIFMFLDDNNDINAGK